MKKNKTYTFRTYTFRNGRKVEATTGSFTREELEAQLLEDCLSRGYIPLWPFYFMPRPMVDKVETTCAYAGKRVAREIWAKHRDSLNRSNFNRIFL